jgi:lactate dehydrogenase-like 2-hydroxyacid dehydrogenase
MSKSVLIIGDIPEAAAVMLRAKGYGVDINMPLKKKPYDAVLSSWVNRIDAKTFDTAPTVKIYANYAIGFDNVDIVEAKKRGITVTNAPGSLSFEAVAEHAIAMMFTLSTRIVEADNFVRRGKFKGWRPMDFIGTDITGKTFGLIGVGRIGEHVAHYANALGMKVVYTDMVKNDRMEKECNATYVSSPEEVLKTADFISLHVPLLDSTKHLIHEARLKMMKPTAFIINTSRGPVIDENALVSALKNRVIAGAALDVFEFEPKLAKGLVKLPNVVLTPHIASASIAARNQMAEIAAQNIIDFLEGRTPPNVVNA